MTPVKRNIRLIAFDLDGTLLTSDKQLSEGNRTALFRAAEKGIEIVPVTGRVFDFVPDFVRTLPFLHYAITLNGAEVLRLPGREIIRRAVIPCALALKIMRFLDDCPVIYDCYAGAESYMSAEMRARAAEYTDNVFFIRALLSRRLPVENLSEFIREQHADAKKILVYTKDYAYKQTLMGKLKDAFPMLSITASDPDDIEINIAEANKGTALLALTKALGLSAEQSLAFGDGLNDISMLKAAGIGVAMGNAEKEVLAAADYVTENNDADGVAAGIYRFCFEEQPSDGF